ncbi:hypothetical protein BDV25DRAFT_138936 [Aspergillus avenaceus]|uniref:Hydrophobin n=1 Tax=Aspergillus avenaceus TaxID=36643 RepID=A0A5N6TYA7_ASPAV|nr:hypothetical protein BDV25DRAFT_138936 [Aspergillus avenaceus]
MQFFTHLIIPFTALTVAAVPWRGDRNKAVCFGFKETCDKPTGQCCPGLKCDLDNYECTSALREFVAGPLSHAIGLTANAALDIPAILKSLHVFPTKASTGFLTNGVSKARCSGIGLACYIR